MMRISSTVLILALGAGTAAAHEHAAPEARMQAAPNATPAAAQGGAQTEAAATAGVTASSLLQPALTQAQATLSSLKVDHWKKGSVREEADQNVNSLLHDLQANMPPLLAAADAEPGSLSRAIPLLKHLDAFYDVLLRVEEASRVSAPGDQISALQQMLLELNKARNSYDDQLQTQAAGQERLVIDLQGQVRAQKQAAEQARAVPAKEVPCKPAAPVRKKRRTTTPQSANPGTTTQKPGSSPAPQHP